MIYWKGKISDHANKGSQGYSKVGKITDQGSRTIHGITRLQQGQPEKDHTSHEPLAWLIGWLLNSGTVG